MRDALFCSIKREPAKHFFLFFWRKMSIFSMISNLKKLIFCNFSAVESP